MPLVRLWLQQSTLPSYQDGYFGRKLRHVGFVNITKENHQSFESKTA